MALALHLVRKLTRILDIRSERNFETAADAFHSGVAKAETGKYEAAIADLDEAVRLRPDFPEAFFDRGNAKAATGDPEGAIADYDEAVRLVSFANHVGSSKGDQP